MGMVERLRFIARKMQLVSQIDHEFFLPGVELVGPDLAYDRRRPEGTGLDADDCRHLRVAVPVCRRQP